MAASSYSTPLAAINAAVLDTETTGLDARVARIVQLGIVAIEHGQLKETEGWEQLLNPGEPIPEATTRVHGITDTDVASAPSFAAMAQQLASRLNDRVVIGHSLAYDFEMLKREHQLAGLDWRQPRALDIRTLARLAAPTLADHSLDRLCEWLDVANRARHTALADAIATGEIFIKLVPLLRKSGVRTLAEAEAACARLAEQDARSSGGIAAVDTAPIDAEAGLKGVDPFAYRHRVRDVMTAPPLVVDGAAPLKEAIRILLEKGSSSVFVSMTDGATGILTERDVLRAVGSQGAAALNVMARDVAKAPLITVVDDAPVYRAIGRMDRLNIRHLGVRNRAGEIVGALTPRNLLRNRASEAIMIGDRIVTAGGAGDLAKAWSEVPRMAASLLREDVDTRTIAGVISTEICNITRRAAQLAEERLAAAGRGGPPVPYAVLVLGSGGRGESLLAADQDNAIVYSEGEPASATDTWFEELGGHIADILDETGILYCKGGVMAKNAAWRHSVKGWGDLVETWLSRQRPEDLLNVDIFFDAIPVHGDFGLGERIWRHAYERARTSRSFLTMLAESGRRWRAPLTMFGGIRSENGRVDLKKGGLLPLVTGARVLSIRHGVPAHGTAERLSAVHAEGVGSPGDIRRIIDAHEVILRAVLDQQIEDGRRGVPLSTGVDLGRLDKRQRADLKDALGAVETMQELALEGRM
jgi:DNA polymerase-3 subunit epsilon/CBS domain-containing protein